MKYNLFLIFLAYFFRLSAEFPKRKKIQPIKNLLEYQIPSQYNFFDELPFCNFHPGNRTCLGDYAQGLFLTMSHRICRKKSKPFKLSYQYLSACDPLNLGCERGNTQSLMYFLEQYGSPSDEDLPWQSIYNYNSSFCSKYRKSDIQFYRISHESGIILTDIIQIQREIYLNGPVSATVTDFLKNENDDRNYEANQSVEIIGWYEKEDLFWITYNEKWGVNYIRAGYNDALIESNIFAFEVQKFVD
ncbi:hypothetical protein M9Y10_009965 [Tritrichomonas musculus]|uniref:Peptidase C1A papain C-terminal domain-containing protein n=1 Tax=Tritrichomonas musculus TaxID=1915356 RepID=A0ABR2IRW4_9EUKA